MTLYKSPLEIILESNDIYKAESKRKLFCDVRVISLMIIGMCLLQITLHLIFLIWKLMINHFVISVLFY